MALTIKHMAVDPLDQSVSLLLSITYRLSKTFDTALMEWYMVLWNYGMVTIKLYEFLQSADHPKTKYDNFMCLIIKDWLPLRVSR